MAANEDIKIATAPGTHAREQQKDVIDLLVQCKSAEAAAMRATTTGAPDMAGKAWQAFRCLSCHPWGSQWIDIIAINLTFFIISI